MVRAFIAVETSTPKMELYMKQIHDFLSKLPIRYTKVDPSVAHITLKFLGEIPEVLVERVISQLEKVEYKSFEIEASGIGFFPNERRPRVVFIEVKRGADKLKRLAEIVEESLSKIGFAREKREFVPHITVARIKSFTSSPKIRELTSLGEQISERIAIRELKLKRSILTSQGPIYSDIYVKPLL